MEFTHHLAAPFQCEGPCILYMRFKISSYFELGNHVTSDTQFAHFGLYFNRRRQAPHPHQTLKLDTSFVAPSQQASHQPETAMHMQMQESQLPISCRGIALRDPT